MSLFSGVATYLRGLDPAARHAEASSMAGFIQTPLRPAPDAGPLVESDQISAIVSRCINVISEDCAHIPLQLLDNRGTKGPKVVDSYPAIDLWRHINPVETQVVYTQQAYADLLVEGNHFGWLDIQNGIPVNMIRMPPEQVEVLPHRTKIIAGYKWTTPDGKSDTYPATEVMHIRTRNPASIYRGMGFLPRLREQIIMDRSLRQYKLSQVRNGIPTTMVFKVNRTFGKAGEFERFQDEMWQKLRGPMNAGKPFFIKDGDVDIEIIKRPTESETAILANLKYTRNEIAMLFGVPPSRLSDYSEAFRANASEQGRTFIQDTIMSWHRLFIDYLNSCFLPKWYGRDSKRYTFAYDYSQVRALALSTRDMVQLNQQAVQSAIRTPNQAMLSIGDPASDDPNADKLYLNGKPLDLIVNPPKPVPAAKPGNKPGETDPQNDDDDGKKPADAQEEADRLLRTVFKGGDDVDLDHMWIASAVFQRDASEGAEGKRRVFGTASTDRVDRMKTFVNQESLGKAAKKYDKQNGKIFYNHNWMIPAGKRIAVEARDDRLMLAAEVGRDYDLILKEGPFDSGVRYPVNDVWKLIEQGNVTSYSVAFNAKEIEPEDEGGPIELMVTDLFEISLVSIPANPDAEFSVMRAADHPVFVKMLRGEARPTQRDANVVGLDTAARAAANEGSKFSFVPDTEDEALSQIEKELNQWLSAPTKS